MHGRFCYIRCFLTGSLQDHGDRARHKTTNVVLNVLSGFLQRVSFWLYILLVKWKLLVPLVITINISFHSIIAVVSWHIPYV